MRILRPIRLYIITSVEVAVRPVSSRAAPLQPRKPGKGLASAWSLRLGEQPKPIHNMVAPFAVRNMDGTVRVSVLMRIANALSRSLAELLNLPSVAAPSGPIEIPPALTQLRERLKSQGQKLSNSDVQDLAGMRFRGAQPETADDWHQLYLLLASKTRNSG